VVHTGCQHWIFPWVERKKAGSATYWWLSGDSSLLLTDVLTAPRSSGWSGEGQGEQTDAVWRGKKNYRKCFFIARLLPRRPRCYPALLRVKKGSVNKNSRAAGSAELIQLQTSSNCSCHWKTSCTSWCWGCHVTIFPIELHGMAESVQLAKLLAGMAFQKARAITEVKKATSSVHLKAAFIKLIPITCWMISVIASQFYVPCKSFQKTLVWISASFMGAGDLQPHPVSLRGAQQCSFCTVAQRGHRSPWDAVGTMKFCCAACLFSYSDDEWTRPLHPVKILAWKLVMTRAELQGKAHVF